MAHCLEATDAINSLRALLGFHPGQRVRALLKPLNQRDEFALEFERWQTYAAVMAKADIEIAADDDADSRQGKVPTTVSWGEVLIEPPATFDVEKTRASLRKKLTEHRGHLQKHQARLNNQEFVQKASPETQTEMEERTAELTSQVGLLEKQLTQLGEPA